MPVTVLVDKFPVVMAAILVLKDAVAVPFAVEPFPFVGGAVFVPFSRLLYRKLYFLQGSRGLWELVLFLERTCKAVGRCQRLRVLRPLP